MKRSAEMERLTYDVAIKKAHLVERAKVPLVDPGRSALHDENDIIALATQIQEADKHLRVTTCGKLSLIRDQIKMLQAQAAAIMKEAEDSHNLHNVACNFTKKPGNTYHLYERPSGQRYFSMLSPEEWGGSMDQAFLGSFRLEIDYSWTPVDKIAERDDKLEWAQKCLNATTGDKHRALTGGFFADNPY